MLTRRTFFTAAPFPALLTVDRSRSEIEALWSKSRHHRRLFDLAETDADLDEASRLVFEIYEEIVQIRPRTVRDMAILIKVIDPDPDMCVWAPAVMAHVNALTGEVA